MRAMHLRAAALLLLALPLAACEPAAGGDPVGPVASGAVVGLVFADRDGDALLDPSRDAPAPGVRLRLSLGGGSAGGRTLVSDSSGVVRPVGVEAGTYRLEVDAASLGDTIEVAAVDSARFTVGAGDTVTVVVRLRYPLVTAAGARAAAPGRRVLLEAVVLSPWGAFGDSTLHLGDRSGALRVVRAAPTPVAAGDSVRALGEVEVVEGRVALASATLFRIGPAAAAEPPEVPTARAASADEGALDASLVRVRGTITRDATLMSGGDTRVVVDDGSGAVEVVLDRDARIAPTLPLQTGGEVEVTGVLVPGAEGGWWLKPRASADLSIHYPELAVREVRSLEPGRFLAVRGVALNAWRAGDATLHVQDSTGVIRAVQVAQNSILAGDLVEVLGTVGTANGLPALVGATAVVAGRGDLPDPRAVSTAGAATAQDAALDAALVRVSGAVADTAAAGTDRLVRVDDGSGALDVVIAGALGLDARGLVPGRAVEITGLLVPTPGGRAWILRPRSREDVRMP